MPIKTSKKYNVLSAFGAFLIWGCWAYFVNSNTSNPYSAIVSGLAQGTASFVITFIMVRFVSVFFNNLQASWAKLILPSFLTICITGSFLALMHYLIGTSKIFFTVAPALTVAFIFCFYTTLQLRKNSL